MIINLSERYYATIDDPLLGYCGEHRARKITFNGLAVEGADRYKLRLFYKDCVSYEVDITEGEYIIDGSILRIPQKVKTQIYAVKQVDYDEYELVKKSQIFELVIKPSLCDEPIPIPTYEAAKSYLDEIIEYMTEGRDYNHLDNRPSIEGHTLENDKTFDELGMKPLSAQELADMWGE